ncbi:GNTI, partial [Symbiodinium sp. CCMP2456]
MVHGLQAEIERLRKENFRLKEKPSSQGSTAQVEMVHNEPQRHTQALSTAELTEDLLKSLASNGAIGVAIVTCKRPKYLSRTMDSVLRAQRDPAKFPLVISQDANDAAMQELVQRSFVKTGQAYHMHHEHDPNAPAIATKYGGKKAIGYVRIAQHFGFVMRRMFDEFGFEA